MCRSMVISTLRPLRLGKEKRKRKKTQDDNIMSASATQGGHNKQAYVSVVVFVTHDIYKLCNYIFGYMPALYTS